MRTALPGWTRSANGRQGKGCAGLVYRLQSFAREPVVPPWAVAKDWRLQMAERRRILFGRERCAAEGPQMAVDEAHPWKAEFAEYLRQDQARLYGYIHSLVRDVHDADDLFQQT